MKKTILKSAFVILGLMASKNVKPQSTNNEPKINYENLYDQIQKTGIKFPDVVFAQAVLETGHFTSKLFKNANNLFGMKMPRKRETLAVGKESRGFAVFSHWTSSVNDYFLWQENILNKREIKTKNDYLALLNRIYAEDTKYVRLLNNVMSKYQHVFD